MNRMVDGKQYVECLYDGIIPEKQLILFGDKTIEQCIELYVFQSDLRRTFAAQCKGFTTTDPDGDMSLQEYTPLRVQWTIPGEDKSLIKQCKAVCDALEGEAFVDDCSIVDLLLQRGDKPEFKIRPYEKEKVMLPNRPPDVTMDMYLKPIKCTAFTMAGYPKDSEGYKYDEKQKARILEAFDKQFTKSINGKYIMHVVIGAKEIAVRQPLERKLAQREWREAPMLRPDLDNMVYALLHALNGTILDENKLSKLHAYKTYCESDDPEKLKIWIEEEKE